MTTYCYRVTLPMYDWPEERAHVDALWGQIREQLKQSAPGLDTPEALSRDPADPTLWSAPDLLLSQCCWGPLSHPGLEHLEPIAQPDFSDVAGGQGPLYRSALVMRRDGSSEDIPVPTDTSANLPDILRAGLSGLRLAYNEPISRSGLLALAEDMRLPPETLCEGQMQTGSHRASIRAVADGHADIAAIDCRSWALARRHEPCAKTLRVVGWTSARMGLPYVVRRDLDADAKRAIRAALKTLGCHDAPANGGKI